MENILLCENCGRELNDIFYFDLIKNKNLCKWCYDYFILPPRKEKEFSKHRIKRKGKPKEKM